MSKKCGCEKRTLQMVGCMCAVDVKASLARGAKLSGPEKARMVREAQGRR